MKKITIIITTISLALMFAFMPKAYAYTLSSVQRTYYNQVTASLGQGDAITASGTTEATFEIYNPASSILSEYQTMRIVFSDMIPSTALPGVNGSLATRVQIYFYTNGGSTLALSNTSYFGNNLSFSYFETNFVVPNTVTGIDFIEIKLSNLPIGYNEDDISKILNGVIIASGNTMIINQTVSAGQYTNGWNDAMNSKVTQIWSLWGNIFDTFMNVFNIFSVQLVGDITIGHIAMVPLVLGLIGFIYALGGKRGR